MAVTLQGAASHIACVLHRHGIDADDSEVTQLPRVGNEDTEEAFLDDLLRVLDVLSDALTERGAGQWLVARNRVLGGSRPLDLLAKGDTDSVIAAAHSFVSGAYI